MLYYYVDAGTVDFVETLEIERDRPKGGSFPIDRMGSRAESKACRQIPPGPGPHGVGCVDIMAGLSTSGVLFRLFYPMEKQPGGPPLEQRPEWLPHCQYAKGYGAVIGKKLAGIVMKWLLSKVTLPVTWNGALSPSKPKYPLVIFSHGLGGCRTTYTSMCIDLASCGLFVAAVEHRDQSACCTFTLADSSSRGEGCSEGGSVRDRYQWMLYHQAPYNVEELRNKQVNQRKDECIAALDYLQDLTEGSQLENDLDPDIDLSQFQGRIDLGSVAVCGHSFGGATTIACLSRDDRFKCGVGCDVWMYPLDESHLKVSQPVLFINTERFQWRENMEALRPLIPDWSATTGHRQMITIRGTVHQNQSDFSLLIPTFLAKMAKLRGSLDPYVAMEINNSAAIRFLSKYLDLDTPDETDSSSQANHIIVGTNVQMEKGEREQNQEMTQEQKETSQKQNQTSEEQKQEEQ